MEYYEKWARASMRGRPIIPHFRGVVNRQFIQKCKLIFVQNADFDFCAKCSEGYELDENNICIKIDK
jgi:hypothetical protein